MIKPTIGRVVWYYANAATFADVQAEKAQPLAALVTYVHSDRLVNVGGFDPNGNHFAATSIALMQEGDPVPGGAFVGWMPYQVGQAKKHDAPSEAAKV